MEFRKITEEPSAYEHLEEMSIRQILRSMNEEDRKVPLAVEAVLPQVECFVEALVERIKNNGRLFYIGAGTSGRLGVLDASELPPTFGIPSEKVVGVIAGGDIALRCAVEHAEDDVIKGWQDLNAYQLQPEDTILGIAASGTTPYVLEACVQARKAGLLTGCICSNPGSPLACAVEYPIEVIVGPEFVTGSSRMKSGTAQKMILNMISTSLMIRMGRVHGNRMVNMQLTNDKLLERGIRMIEEQTYLSREDARNLLLEYGSVKKVIDHTNNLK